MKHNVRPMKLSEVHHVINYFLEADHTFLAGMGVDPTKLPQFDQWYETFCYDFERPLHKRKRFYLIWALDEVLVGHSHINDIVYGKEAFMHLHIWQSGQRQSGNGTFFIQESIKSYFEMFNLTRLFCQPYALNPAPNRTLERVGFEFVEAYETTPGWINFHQVVNLWVLDRERFKATIDQMDIV